MGIEEVISVLGARLRWCDGRIDLFEGEVEKEFRYLDKLSKIAGPLVQAFKLRGVEAEDDGEDLAKIFEEIARRRESKKTIRLHVSD